MKGFMAVVFNIVLVRQNEFTGYWSTRQGMNTPWFRMFSCDHFRKILHAFHIVDNSVIPARDDPSYRPSVRLRPLLDYMNNICMHYFSSCQAVAIDKSLVAGKVCNPTWQYLPNKHHARFGRKIWLIANSNTAYVLQCYVYEEANYDPSSKVAASGYVVIRLMEMAKCSNKGHHLFTDNLFMTYAAAASLLQRGSFLTETMCRNQLHHLPNEITTTKPKTGQKIYFRHNKFLAMLYRQKQSQNKPVIMSLSFCGAFVSLIVRKKIEEESPCYGRFI